MLVVTGPCLTGCFGFGGSSVGWPCCNIGGGGGCVVMILCWMGGAASRDGIPITKGASSAVMARQASVVSSVVEKDTWVWLSPTVVVDDSISRLDIGGRSGMVSRAIYSCTALCDGSQWNHTHIGGARACRAEAAGDPSLFFFCRGETDMEIWLVDIERVDIISSWSVVLMCGVCWLTKIVGGGTVRSMMLGVLVASGVGGGVEWCTWRVVS